MRGCFHLLTCKSSDCPRYPSLDGRAKGRIMDKLLNRWLSLSLTAESAKDENLLDSFRERVH